jgi:hypothetical protein
MLALAACSAAPAPLDAVATPAPPLPPREDFSAERAWQHWAALTRHGPRAAGSEASGSARAYLRDELTGLGLQVTEQIAERIEPGPPERVQRTVNLLAEIPGASRDLIVLVASYDSPSERSGSAAPDDASGAALLLELGRALQVRGPLFTILLAFVEGDAAARGSGATESVAAGAEALVAALAGDGSLERVRLAVAFDGIASPDLRVARDLLSSRVLREEFWSAARRQGRDAIFPAAAPFEVVDGSHRAFLSAGMRRAVAISGARPAAEAEQAQEAVSPEPDAEGASRASLSAVGAVGLDAIATISQRLAKIDRFARSPLSSDTEIAASPGAEERAAEAEADAGGVPTP